VQIICWEGEAMSGFWYYAEGDETRGPVSFDQLVELLSQLPTHRGVPVWREGFTDWTPAENVREIVEKLIRPPPLGRRSSAIPPPLPESADITTPPSPILREETGLLSGMKRKAKMLRESFVAAGVTNTGKVTATVGNKRVLNWHGTATQRDDALRMFPGIRDRMMPGVELGSFADAMIAVIHEEGMSPDDFMSSVQTIAMLWRVFTTPFDPNGTTYGELIAIANMHAAFKLHEQPNGEFKVTWKISVMRGRRS
jgi:GYF domain 2